MNSKLVLAGLLLIAGYSTGGYAQNTDRLGSACGTFLVETGIVHAKDNGDLTVEVNFTPTADVLEKVYSIRFGIKATALVDATDFPRPAKVFSRARTSRDVSQGTSGAYPVRVRLESPVEKVMRGRKFYDVEELPLPSGEYMEFTIEGFVPDCGEAARRRATLRSTEACRSCTATKQTDACVSLTRLDNMARHAAERADNGSLSAEDEMYRHMDAGEEFEPQCMVDCADQCG